MKALHAIFFTLCMSGCITSAYHKSNVEYAHATREFQLDGRSAISVSRGVWGGIREWGGQNYHHLQFSSILKGVDRWLDVLLPVKSGMAPGFEFGSDGQLRPSGSARSVPGEILFTESNRRLQGKQSAYLILHSAAVSSESRDWLAGQMRGQKSDPVAMLREYHGLQVDDEYPVAIVELNFTINYRYTTRGLVWEKGPNGKPVVVCDGLDLADYDSPHLGVQWKERSRIRHGLRQLGYAGTVLADVVTAPIQLAYWILLGLAGPGAK